MVLLLAIWPAVTSHALLQQFGLIHQAHHHHHGDDGSHEHHSDNHAFADGDYTSAGTAQGIAKPQLATPAAALLFPVPFSFSALLINGSPGPAPPRAAPPLLQHSWCFLLRTALPARAPSLTESLFLSA